MDTTILDKKIIISEHYSEIKIRDLIKRPMVNYITGDKSKKILLDLSEYLNEYNLVFGMNDFDLKLYEINPNSILFTTKLWNLFDNKIYNLLKRRRIYTLSQLLLTSRYDLMSIKRIEFGRALPLSSNVCDEIYSQLIKLSNDLKLGMSENEILEFVNREKTQKTSIARSLKK